MISYYLNDLKYTFNIKNICICELKCCFNFFLLYALKIALDMLN